MKSGLSIICALLLFAFLFSAIPLVNASQPPPYKCPEPIESAILSSMEEASGHDISGGCTGYDNYFGGYSVTIVSEKGNSYVASFQVTANSGAARIDAHFFPNVENMKRLLDFIELQPFYQEQISKIENPSRIIYMDGSKFFNIAYKHAQIFEVNSQETLEKYNALPHLYFYYGNSGSDTNHLEAFSNALHLKPRENLGFVMDISEFQPLYFHLQVDQNAVVLPDGYSPEYAYDPVGPAPLLGPDFLPSHIFEWPYQLWVGLTLFFLALYWVLRKRIEKSRVGELFNDYWLGEKYFSNHSVIWGLLLMSIVFLVFDFVSHNGYFAIRDAFGFDVYQGLEVLVSSIIGLMLLALWFNMGKNLARSDHPVVWSVVAPFLHLVPLAFIFAYLFTYVTFGGTPYIGGFFDSLFLLPKLLPVVASLGLFLNFKPKVKKKQGLLETFSQKIPLIILILTGLFWGFLIFVELFISTTMILY